MQIHNLRLGKCTVKASARIYFNVPSMYVWLAVFGEPDVDLDLTVSVLPVGIALPNFLTKDWFADAVSTRLKGER